MRLPSECANAECGPDSEVKVMKYRWRTLQLLPGAHRRSYAGRTVEVCERLEGELSVLYEDQEIATQEAVPRASVQR